MTHKFPDVQAGFRKGRRTRDQIGMRSKTCWIIEEAREFQKKISISALLTTPKTSTVWITKTVKKFFKRWDYLTTSPVS